MADQLLPTPLASRHYKTGGELTLAGSVAVGRSHQLLPTPTAKLGDKKRGAPSERLAGERYEQGKRNLDDALALGKLWPTPTVADSRSTARGTQDGTTLTDALRSHTGKRGDVLSPRFVEWMMGCPIGWTDLEYWAIPSSPKQPASPSKSSRASSQSSKSKDGSLELFASKEGSDE
jgi:hypothetical protein